ncbi:MAG: ABC transporter substrate-binding protein [Candidatus Latescibacterota bacterium]|nr:ABC transporter substrate-binding protein [Candidatus Latescibacterota bacterium]
MKRSIWLLVILAACVSPEARKDHLQLLLDWKAQMEHVGFFVAKANGFYEKAGISLEILEGNGAPTTAKLVGNGTYKIGLSSGSATVMARSKGIPVVSLAVINQHSPVVVYSLVKSGLTKPSHLIGKRIGVNIGGTKHREFQALLRKLKIGENQIQLMGMTESSPAPLLAGQVDAMLGYTEDQPVTVENRGEKVNRIALSDYGIDLYSTNIIVNESYLASNPDLVGRFLKASLKGWAYAVDHPKEAVDTYTAKRPETDRKFNEANFSQLIRILQSPDVSRDGFGAQTSERWSSTQDILYDLGMIESRVDIGSLFTNNLR